MEIEGAITDYLLSYTGLTALVGDRIYPDEADEGAALPYIVYIDISDVPNHKYGGQSTYSNPIKQYTVKAETRASAKEVAAQIKAALCDYNGTLSGLEVQYIKLLNEFTSKEKLADGSASVFFSDLEFEINWIRS